MVNNFGGGEFHYSTTLANDPTMDLHTSAAHTTQAQGWVESVGFKYFAVHNNDEYQKALRDFMSPQSEKPIFIEVFSDMELDATNTHLIERNNRTETLHEKLSKSIKDKVKNAIRLVSR